MRLPPWSGLCIRAPPGAQDARRPTSPCGHTWRGRLCGRHPPGVRRPPGPVLSSSWWVPSAPALAISSSSARDVGSHGSRRRYRGQLHSRIISSYLQILCPGRRPYNPTGAVRPRTLDCALDRAAFQTRARVQGRSCRWFAATFRPCTPVSAVEGGACSTRSSARVQLGMCTDEHGIVYGLAHVCAGATWLCRTRGKFQKSSLARTSRHLHACKGQRIGSGRRSQRREKLAQMYAQ